MQLSSYFYDFRASSWNLSRQIFSSSNKGTMGLGLSHSRAQVFASSIPDPPSASLALNYCTSQEWPLIFSKISQYVTLKSLSLSDCNIGDSQLEHLSKIESIEVLDLSKNTHITDFGIECLMTLPNLRELIMNGKAEVTERGFGIILNRGLQKVDITLPNIRNLSIEKVKIGNRGADQISRSLPGLKCLMIENCGVTLEGITAIARSLKLTHLYAQNNRFGDEAAIVIARNMHSLTTLSLNGNELTPRGAIEIAVRLKNLQYLCLKSNNFSKPTISQLQSLLPKAQICGQ